MLLLFPMAIRQPLLLQPSTWFSVAHSMAIASLGRKIVQLTYPSPSVSRSRHSTPVLFSKRRSANDLADASDLPGPRQDATTEIRTNKIIFFIVGVYHTLDRCQRLRTLFHNRLAMYETELRWSLSLVAIAFHRSAWLRTTSLQFYRAPQRGMVPTPPPQWTYPTRCIARACLRSRW